MCVQVAQLNREVRHQVLGQSGLQWEGKLVGAGGMIEVCVHVNERCRRKGEEETSKQGQTNKFQDKT